MNFLDFLDFPSLRTATYFESSSTRPVFPRRTRAERANRVLELYQTPTRRGASLCTKHSHNGHFRARNQTLFAAWGQHDQYLALVLKFFGNFMAFPVRENWSRGLRLKFKKKQATALKFTRSLEFRFHLLAGLDRLLGRQRRDPHG